MSSVYVLCKVCVSDFYRLDDLDFFCSHKRSSRWEKKRWAKRPNCNYELKLCCQSAAATHKVPAVLIIRNLNKSLKGARLLKVLFFARVQKRDVALSLGECIHSLSFQDKKLKFWESTDFWGQEIQILGAEGVFGTRKPKPPVTHSSHPSAALISLLLADFSFRPLPSNLSLFWLKILGSEKPASHLGTWTSK